MRKAIIPFIIALMAVMTISAQTRAQVRASISIDRDGVRDFNITYSTDRCVVKPDIIVVQERRLPAHEMAVAELIADRAGISVRRIVTLRNRNWSWMRITRELGLTANIFFIRVGHHSYPTCVKIDKDYKDAVKHMKKAVRQARKELRKHGAVRLSDREIERLVQWQNIIVAYEIRDGGRLDHRLGYDTDLSDNPPAKPVRGYGR
jgi:hypothetical protein